MTPTTPAPAVREAAPGDGETATYVFAVCRGGDPAALRACGPGHREGGALRVLSAAGLTAVVQDVPVAVFSEEALPERLADREALEAYARAHHGVVHAAAGCAATAPLPFATLYRDDARARAAVRSGAARFHAVLDRIGDRVEWGVKVHRVSRAEAAAPGAERPADPTAPGAGRAYLERIRGRNRAREQRQDAALRAAELAHRALGQQAVAARRLRAHSAELSGDTRPQVLNAAYLVDRHRAALVPELVARLRGEPWAEDVRFEITGPWVPYSFTDPESAPEARDDAD
ncbi:GvpL/GvpF family gas vesicle protein [Streptomyces sp. HNM0574]|uniref:GvpL/GvpF family gas vesicle protein n=1 Tax=Streptomyces sp. HNM0574 TaxID=2714954 RepID=UPI001469BE3B|nr:GvpL/GvpF family gas vesicle protein [Streptomyces sp. HNM0574]NLU70721.1 GvpL/GvpF family gas vesicle protein [Streptomyces sp. HNM0574]